MINKQETIEKIINKKFDTLEDKINIIQSNIECMDNLTYIMYHGTGINEAEIILKEGLKPSRSRPIFLTPDKKVAEDFSKTEQHYFVTSNKSNIPRKGVILKIIITEEDFQKQLKKGIDSRIVDIRRENLKKAIKENWFEYEWYSDISPNQIHLLINENIFDITTTGMPYYNSMIQKGHIAGNRDPVEYFKSNKGIVFKIEWMSPDEYLEKSFEIHRILQSKYRDISNLIVKSKISNYLTDNIDPDLIQEYTKRTLEGSKMPIPMLDYNNMSQEGRHRAVVAQQLNVEEIPVLVVRPYEE